MPRINLDEANTYGTQPQDERLSFRERLMKRFSAHDWVRVINVDDEAFTWQYLPQHAEDFEFTPDPMKITRRGEVEAYRLDPGQSEVIIGENAYVMIEALYKKVVSKRVIDRTPGQPATLARNFNWNDATAQEELINEIFLGKESPSFKNAPNSRMNNVVEQPVTETAVKPIKPHRIKG